MRRLLSGVISTLTKIVAWLAGPFRKKEPAVWKASSDKRLERALREVRSSIKKKKRASRKQGKKAPRKKFKA